MKKRLASAVLALVMLLSLVPAFSINAFAATRTVTSGSDSRIEYMLNNISYQNFGGSTVNGVKVTCEQVVEKIRHFIYDSNFAAIDGGTFNYPNSGAYTWEVSDGTYNNVAIRGSTGCCAYCYYVSKVIYGKDWVDSAQQTKLYSAAQLKSFLLTYAQAGEHLRADPSHSVTFISGDDEGFYCFSYCGDGTPVIHLDYWTYADFYAKYGGYSIYVYDIYKADNTSTMGCKDGHHYNCNVVTAPTKTSAGTLRCYCPVCRNTKSVTLPILNKTDYDFTSIGSTTCTSGAIERYTLKDKQYGTFYFDVQLASGSHAYAYSLAAEPTETAEGSIKCYCPKCQSTEYIPLPVLNGMDFDMQVIGEATCTKGCILRYTWKDTQYGSYHFDKEIPPMGHAYLAAELNEVTAAPTAESEGRLVCRCFRCSETLTITLPKFSDTEYSYAVKVPPTVSKCGVGTYTWLVEEYGSYSFDVEIPKLDHVENPFIDVKDTAVYYDAVLWASGNKITSGFDATHFRPDADCTRGQVVTFLWRAAGSPEPASSVNPFKDVSEKQSNGKDNPYYKAILWAAEEGITKGTDASHFSPNATVTRAQFVTFLYRFEHSPATAGSIYGFTDAMQIATPYRTAVAWAVENGITTGYGDDTFRPNDPCKRWAVVLFMYRDIAE